MKVPKGKCCSTVVLPDFGAGTRVFPIPVGQSWAITYKIGATIIAGPITFGPSGSPITLTAGDVQTAINADSVYQASGTTVTVNYLDSNGLSVTICKKTNKKITDSAEGIFIINTNP